MGSGGSAPVEEAKAPTFSGFLARLLGYLFLVSLLFSVLELHEHLGPLQRGMAWVVVHVANLMGAEANGSGSLIQLRSTALDINHECTGIFVLLVYTVFVLAYPAPARERLRGILVGTVLLFSVNMARLVLLTVIASARPNWFDYMHEYFFQGVFIALLAFLASVWTEQVRRAAHLRVSG